ncbi:MAG: hypothetical protein WKF40_11215 [Thermoleophilaceae bacterium]
MVRRLVAAGAGIVVLLLLVFAFRGCLNSPQGERLPRLRPRGLRAGQGVRRGEPQPLPGALGARQRQRRGRGEPAQHLQRPGRAAGRTRLPDRPPGRARRCPALPGGGLRVPARRRGRDSPPAARGHRRPGRPEARDPADRGQHAELPDQRRDLSDPRGAQAAVGSRAGGSGRRANAPLQVPARRAVAGPRDGGRPRWASSGAAARATSGRPPACHGTGVAAATLGGQALTAGRIGEHLGGRATCR